jgi:hypothetical protein
MRDMASSILDKFISTAYNQVFEVLRQNQARLGWRKELAETKRYKELEAKMASIAASLKVLKDDIAIKDRVLLELRDIKTHQMAHYVDLEDKVIKSDFDRLKDVLSPYTALIAPLEEIRMIQSSIASQGKLKKLTLPYDEIAEALKHAAVNIAAMSEKVDDLISYAMQTLEKVA